MAVRELEPAYPGSPPPIPARPRDRTLVRCLGSLARCLEALARWLDRPLVPGLAALLGALGFALARWQRWSRGDIGSWILVGRTFTTPGRMWLAPGIGIRPGSGYDGQFYYRLALNPANLRHTAYGISLDAPYRLMRIGYPVLTWLASAGQAALVPVMLVAVNVTALGTIGWLGGAFARQGGHHAAWGLLLPAYFGLLTSVSRDTAEPVACALLLAGLLAIRYRHSVLAGVLLAFGVLTRETVIVAAGAVAAVRLVAICRRRQRIGRPDLAWLLPAAAFITWEVVVRAVTGSFPLDADDDRNAGTPFIAAYDAVRNNLHNLSWTEFTWTDIWLLEFAVLIVVAAMALACLRRSRGPAHERVALVGFLIEILVVTPTTWNSLNADLRSFVEVYLLAVVVLLGMPGVRLTRHSLNKPVAWLLPVAAAWALPALIVVGSRRIFWS